MPLYAPLSTSGSASGDLTGTYPGPTVAKSSASTWATYGITPTARPAAYTLTFGPAATRTLASDTAVAVDATSPVNIPATSLYAFSSAQASGLLTAVNALMTDLDNTKQVVKQIVTDLKAQGHFQ